MRRIPRPQRAIDPSLPISSLLQRRITPPACLRAAASQPHLRTTSACFSTTPTFNFLLGGKPDKKKHQAFVRRWQKRILGDSEPIGAHVDPYDPTSPVRIAPEEQGEEIEVLAEDEGKPAKGVRSRQTKDEKFLGGLRHRKYKEATQGPLLHVGGKEWIEHAEEINMAKEFEKLTLRTYTPMTQDMADQIERWTGTYYTLRDENLMMAQTFDEGTGKPYTDFSFGRYTRVTKPETLRNNFHQAVIEIHALKQAGKDLDMSKQTNRGIYDTPEWMKDVKLQRNGEGEFILSFPSGQTLETLLREMEHVPDYAHSAPEVLDADLQEEFLAEEGEPLAPEALEPPPPPPTMDPATPAFKRAALVKDDQDKPKFDFMSNRPVPRTPKPAEPTEPVAEVVKSVREVVLEEPVAVPEPASPVPAFDFEAALATSTSTISELRHAVLESAACSAEQDVSAIRDALRDSITSISSQTVARLEKPGMGAKWQHVPLVDLELKFALSKRLTQLTGHYISDPQLTSSKHLGDLYHHICGIVKPTPTDVHTYINVEGARQNHNLKQLERLAKKNPSAAKKIKVKTNAGELLKLNNVQLLKKKESRAQRRVKTGLNKVVRRELRAKGLIHDPKVQRDDELDVYRKARVQQRAELKHLTRVFKEFQHDGTSPYPRLRSSQKA